MHDLKITIVQPVIVWEDIAANLGRYSNMLANVEKTDVILLPEMFTTGFSMHPEKLKEPMNGPSVEWMKKLATQKDASVAGSLIVEENKRIYNRAVWVFPDGNIETYDKRHLYTMGQEHLHYTPGSRKTIVAFRGWKFCPLICYDLRFPVWSRNTEDYDVLIYMANWPSPRHHIWKNLLVARAVENQCCCVGVNRTGTDGEGLHYLGNSAVVSPKGFAKFLSENEEVKTFEISGIDLQNFRKSFPLLRDMDRFNIV